MNENDVLKLFDEGHSVDYIIGYLLIESNKNTKQYDSLTREWHIKKPKHNRQQVTDFVYKTLLNRHLKILREGDKSHAK